MKKLALLTLLLASSLISAQQENTWVFGGEVGYSNSNLEYLQGNNSESDNTQFTILARLGYIFIKTNFEIGLGLGYAQSEQASIFSNTSDKFITTIIAPYTKKFFPINEKFAFHLIGEVSYSKSYRDSSTESDELDMRQYGVALRPGFVYFVTKHIALNANLGALVYTTSTSKSKTFKDIKNNTFGFNVNGNNISLGIAYYL
ncbi:outer membrane beta-barrel protein [Polaribacter cellanae]|uniref:Outer membrane beta-barrel protein n=1 Tax=Polaribacter cellanae TaxID=2818493 RepID=A0A975H8D2_9FLAO|nr:outer membrane beta-barrel protein [Polaribacter cellanae]QTE23924.1 outer membrane beta-barrel protein [Polaribacter cellanae]